MKQFVNPVFQAIDDSANISYRRSVIPQSQIPSYQQQQLPQEYEKIFSSQTDMSSRLNDSIFNSFDNRLHPQEYWGTRESQNTNILSLTQVVDQKQYAHEIIKFGDDDSILNSSFFGAFNTTSDKIQQGYQQIDSIYNRLGDVSNMTHQNKLVKTICDEELKAELRDKVEDLKPLIKYSAGVKPPTPVNLINPQEPIEYKSRFQTSNYEIHKANSDNQSTKSYQSYLSPQQRNSQIDNIKAPSPTKPEPYLRHSSFLTAQSGSQQQLQKQPSEVYFSQLIDNNNNNQRNMRPSLGQIRKTNIINSHLPSELGHLSRHVQSPGKMTSPKNCNSPIIPNNSDRFQQQKLQTSHSQYLPQNSQQQQQQQQQQQHIQANQQKQLFNQAEQLIKIKRTQPQQMKPNWQKKVQSDKVLVQGITQKEDMQVVLCVICEEYVSFENADTHSAICLAKSKMQAQTQSTQNLIQSLNSKLESIKQSINSQTKSDYLQHQQVLECLTEIILCQKNYKRLSIYTEQLFKMFQQYQSPIEDRKFIMILLIQRAVSLAQEKCLKMQFLEENQNVSQIEDESYLISELSRLEKQAEQEKANLETWKKEHEMMMLIQQQDLQNMKYLRAQYLEQNIDNELLSQINSDWDVKPTDIRTQHQATNSVVSDLIYQRDLESNYGVKNNKVSSPLLQEDLKREFFSLAVQMKLNLPHNHPGKNLLLQDAYDKAMEQKIQRQNWERFIWEEIQFMK